MSTRDRIVVLGLGNVLCGDDGAGVAAVESFRQLYDVPPHVEILDGGTLGLTLLSRLEGARAVILLDALRTDDPPGTFVRLEGERVEPAVRQRLTVHQVGVADLLDALRLLDDWPETLVLLGVVARDLDLHVGLSPPVAATIPRMVEETLIELVTLGVRSTLRKGSHETPWTMPELSSIQPTVSA